MLIPSWLAHEVYVLTPQQISTDESGAKFHPWQALSTANNLKAFFILGFIVSLSLLAAIYLKTKPFFSKLGRWLDKATYFAPDIIRVSLGASLIFSAHFHSVFGPELPVDMFANSGWFEPFLYISGAALIVGLGSRVFGAIVSLFWLFTLATEGWYMLTYVNYLGEALALALISRQNISLDALIFKAKKAASRYDDWAMPIARILFAFSLLYAAINVKFVTAALSLDVVNRYDLSKYFHFDPAMVVFGAGLVECLIGILYLLGLLQRLNSLIFIGFVTASLLFFKESVWPHYLLLGLAAGIFLHKPDKWALDGKLLKFKRPRIKLFN